ncbi:hypothetical protein BN85410290 [Alteracholeplasma palmae J233]|uniref:Uncharacterized protein n=1 Tax=Alteracholeplasma palmae (strain ATCC 49389 / J233) TaxID=1318466 RepID=U4KS05_ALTPJ|nr:hypothetical protein [Alteracholeplasma palmae]CCV64606.1 hypothetical protein BN85410290 [Alteracholeplasma palmae J233]
MQKRKSPLEVKEEPKVSLNKRTNPLELEKKTTEVKTLKETEFKVFTIDNANKIKRKLTITKLSKVLLETVKTMHPDKKTGVILENALLEYLQKTNELEYKKVVDILSKKEGNL